MGEVIRFEVGCRMCANLVQMDKNSFMCSCRSHMDDSDVVPIRNGKHTEDWNICDGESYQKLAKSRIRGGKDGQFII